jgi:hypothetical protein
MISKENISMPSLVVYYMLNDSWLSFGDGSAI